MTQGLEQGLEQELLNAVKAVRCQADLIEAIDLKINNLLDELKTSDKEVFSLDIKRSIEELERVREALINLK